MSNKPSLSINLGLPAVPEISQEDMVGPITNIHNAIRNVMYAVDAYTGNDLIAKDEYAQVSPYARLTSYKTEVLFLKLTEQVTQGDMINIWNSGGARGRKALGGTSRAHAFAMATGDVGDTIPVCLSGLCAYIGGLTPGTDYHLAGTAGMITNVTTYHRVGFAVGPNHLWFSPSW